MTPFWIHIQGFVNYCLLPVLDETARARVWGCWGIWGKRNFFNSTRSPRRKFTKLLKNAFKVQLLFNSHLHPPSQSSSQPKCDEDGKEAYLQTLSLEGRLEKLKMTSNWYFKSVKEYCNETVLWNIKCHKNVHFLFEIITFSFIKNHSYHINSMMLDN